MAIKILIILTIYFLGVNVHISPRSELTMIPFFVISLVAILGIFIQKYKPKTSTVNYTAFSVAVVVMAIMVFNFTEVISSRAKSGNSFQKLESMITHDAGFSYSPNQVFTTNFDVYLPGNKPYYLYKNGGWLRREKIFHDKLFPNLSVKHIDSFKADCSAKGINYIVLDKNSGELASFFGELFYGKPIDGFDEVGTAGEFRVFAIN